MDDMEQKLNSILSNPDMMAQIMSMAQNLGQGPPPSASPEPPMGMDPMMLQKIAGIVQKSGIDKDQQALLRALDPYLTRERVQKLEKAMRAAKIAALASGMLGQTGILQLLGR